MNSENQTGTMAIATMTLNMLNRSWIVVAWAIVLEISGAAQASPQCPTLAERFKFLLGIEGDFDTRLRVERKSTNTIADAMRFRETLTTAIRKELGESAGPRDLPPDPATQELVTATVYPFSRKVQAAMNARIRIREYGVRGKGKIEDWTSTTGYSGPRCLDSSAPVVS
jgi:hypothetical protein